jgi:hypothetical protein
MKIILSFIVTISFLQKLTGQDSVHVVRGYINSGPKTQIDSLYSQVTNTIFIILDTGFDDSIYITDNGMPALNRYLKTNHSIDYAGAFEIYFKDSSEAHDLKIKFVNGNFYIREKVNLHYKALNIGLYNSWELTYSNHFPMRE